MRRAPHIIACLLLWMLGGLACDAIPITIPLDDGNKSLPETGMVADAAGNDDMGQTSYPDRGIPPWGGDAGPADSLGDGWMGDGWPGDGWPGDGWPGDGWPGDGPLNDGTLLDGDQPDGLTGLDAGSPVDGATGE